MAILNFDEDFTKLYERFLSTFSGLRGKSILITGSTGLVGRFFVLFLLFLNKNKDFKMTIFATGRDERKFANDFPLDPSLCFVKQDVLQAFLIDENPDYVFHLASNASPNSFALSPVSTEMTCILGTFNVLSFAEKAKAKVVFASSGDIYGSLSDPLSSFKEENFGCVDCNALRSAYTEGKRASESLCQAFIAEKGLRIVIGRLGRIYGPTVSISDNRAVTEFILNSAHRDPIILKSSGNQVYSYVYVGDVVSALIFLALVGSSGEAYNVSNDEPVSLRNLAQICSSFSKVPVIFDVTASSPKSGYSGFSNSILNNDKLKNLGWYPIFPLKESVEETIDFFKKENV